MRWQGLLAGAALVLSTAGVRAQPAASASAPPASPPAAPTASSPAAAPSASSPAAAAAPEAAPAPATAAPPAQPEAASPEPTDDEPEPPVRKPPAPATPAHSPLARSDWAFGVDASVGPIPDLSAEMVGGALAARFGYRIDTGRVFITPEAILALAEITGQRTLEDDSGIVRFHSESAWIGAGARAGARFWRFEPAVFAHAFIWFGGTSVPAVDFGLALDFRITRSVAIGPHAAFITAIGLDSLDFGVVGLHVDLMR